MRETAAFDDYFAVRIEHSSSGRDNLKQESFQNAEWEDLMAPYAFPCAIIRKTDQTFLGYINILDTSVKIREISIELYNVFTGMGYGYKAMALFIKQVEAATGHQDFKCYILPDNIPCQRLMDKLHATDPRLTSSALSGSRRSC